MSQPRYTEEQLIELLLTLRDRVGRTPRQADTHSYSDIPSHSTYVNRFGTWLKALEVAGLERQRYNRETLLAWIREVADKLGRTPRHEDILAAGGPSATTYRNHLGSWTAALRELGLEPRHRPGPLYSRDYLIEALRGVAQQLGRAPSFDEMKDRGDVPHPARIAIALGPGVRH
jgi:hypothetical protein